MKVSHRNPGYTYRRSGVTDVGAFAASGTARYEVHGDARAVDPDLTAKPSDARRAGTLKKRSPLT
ncbi:MAG: hypothetical protein K6T78_08645 [Alicyclobacillus sp.]|nr:hypothetical protein [Alicyclobacillus sp.]